MSPTLVASILKLFGEKDTKTGSPQDNQTTHLLRFWHKPLFETQDEIRTLVEPQGITNTEVALRWMLHHSKLQDGDGIIIGGSSIPQIQQNLDAIKNSAPLGEDVLQAIDRCWEDIRGVCPPYFR